MTATSTDFVWHRRESQTRNNNQHSPRRCFFSKYSISIERITTISVTLYGNGTYLRMYVKDGDKLYLHHHTVSISKFSAHMELLSGRISASGQPFLSFLIIAIPGDT